MEQHAIREQLRKIIIGKGFVADQARHQRINYRFDRQAAGILAVGMTAHPICYYEQAKSGGLNIVIKHTLGSKNAIFIGLMLPFDAWVTACPHDQAQIVA